MTSQTRRIAAVLSASALLAGGGIAVADAAKSTTGTQKTRSARAGGKHRGPIPAAALGKIAVALGVSTADLRAALEANRPAAPAGEGPGQGPAQFAADLAAALGVETSAVQAILDENRPPRPPAPPADGTRPGRPDPTKLIAALASGLNIDEATVKAAFDKLEAAHEAEHTAREEAMYAAVAKTLGKTAAEVKAAFEANRPPRPAH